MTLSDKKYQKCTICDWKGWADTVSQCPGCGELRCLISAKQETPTKQGWEERFEKEITPEIIRYGQNTSLRTPKLVKTIIAFIRSLLRSKDQEADRRVDEAVKEIEKAIQDEINGITSFQTSPQSYQGLSEALDIIKQLSSK